MEFKKYRSIENTYREKYIEMVRQHGYDHKDILWYATEKIDGCLDEATEIYTKEYGLVPIKFIVDNKLKCKVLAYNTDENIIIWDNVINYSAEHDNLQWYKLILENGIELT